MSVRFVSFVIVAYGIAPLRLELGQHSLRSGRMALLWPVAEVAFPCTSYDNPSHQGSEST